MTGLRKRSVNLAGHATSLALEPEFWAALEVASGQRGLSLAGLIQRIDQDRGERPLASACRVFALANTGQAAPFKLDPRAID
ncbi:ribbon-helix-helix domain-containing protein [Caulobacter sp. SL161]|uniref:ribbon-helix-helix domain-containing protein n=1 Tax=Caulobacter sp. SL161 TaxID=2995156 RepID=UPI002274BE3C|nr:ribbon-helix-helix domain-containing protein [Caulobacter sp. SL161]MCY1647543.1 ribbon-helix-helix domain-containing protein [Caulobacter sp. SL161]